MAFNLRRPARAPPSVAKLFHRQCKNLLMKHQQRLRRTEWYKKNKLEPYTIHATNAVGGLLCRVSEWLRREER